MLSVALHLISRFKPKVGAAIEAAGIANHPV